MNTEEPKPCPFCGQANALPVVEGDGEHLAVMVHCYNCGGRGPAEPVELRNMGCRAVLDILTDITEATGVVVEEWNMRQTTNGNESELIDALEDALRWMGKLTDWKGAGDPDIDRYRAAISKVRKQGGNK